MSNYTPVEHSYFGPYAGPGPSNQDSSTSDWGSGDTYRYWATDLGWG